MHHYGKLENVIFMQIDDWLEGNQLNACYDQSFLRRVRENAKLDFCGQVASDFLPKTTMILNKPKNNEIKVQVKLD